LLAFRCPALAVLGFRCPALAPLAFRPCTNKS